MAIPLVVLLLVAPILGVGAHAADRPVDVRLTRIAAGDERDRALQGTLR